MTHPSGIINILVIDSTFGLGGAETVTCNIFNRVNKQRFRIVVCTFYDPGAIGEQFRNRGCTLYSNITNYKYDLRILARLRWIIRQNHIDLIYLINQPLTLFWGLLAGKLCAVPIISVIHSCVSIKSRRIIVLYRHLLPFVDRIILVAHQQKREVSFLRHIPQHLIRVIHNGVDPGEFARRVDEVAKCNSLALPSNCSIVGIVSRMETIKGIDIFCSAAKHILQQTDNVVFLVIGDGSQIDAFKQLSATLGLADKVHFLGTRRDIPELLQVMDVAVLASRTEALPMTVLEYMASGRPVVATDVGGVRELITDGITGFLVPPDNPTALAAKILQLLNNRELRTIIGDNAKRQINERFTLDITVRETEDICEQLANGVSHSSKHTV